MHDSDEGERLRRDLLSRICFRDREDYGVDDALDALIAAVERRSRDTIARLGMAGYEANDRLAALEVALLWIQAIPLGDASEKVAAMVGIARAALDGGKAA